MLTFDELRKQNVARCEEAFHSLMAWSGTDWGCALAGEVGEACNIAKKIRRGDFSDYMPADGITNEGLDALADELADVICYADLMAARFGINLGEAVARKFNEVSRRRNNPRRLLEGLSHAKA